MAGKERPHVPKKGRLLFTALELLHCTHRLLARAHTTPFYKGLHSSPTNPRRHIRSHAAHFIITQLLAHPFSQGPMVLTWCATAHLRPKASSPCRQSSWRRAWGQRLARDGSSRLLGDGLGCLCRPSRWRRCLWARCERVYMCDSECRVRHRVGMTEIDREWVHEPCR